MKSLFLDVVVPCSIGIIVALLMLSSIMMKNPPVVHWSVSKDQCIKVTNPPVGCGCENLPVKYERIWVK